MSLGLCIINVFAAEFDRVMLIYSAYHCYLLTKKIIYFYIPTVQTRKFLLLNKIGF
jgi:hypothetical protein